MLNAPIDLDTPRPEIRPKARPVGPVPGPRIACATIALVVAVGAIELSVRSWGDGAVASIVSVALGMLVVPIVASPIEWFVHRFVYHAAVIQPLGPIFKVHTAHHYAFFPTWRYVTGGPARRLAIRAHAPDVHSSRWGNARVRLAHFGWYMALGAIFIVAPAWLVAGSNTAFMIGVVVSLAIVSNLFIVVHDTIHRPRSHRIVEAQPWYPFLDRHHYVHHVDLGANLNFLLPLADLLFGTLRRTLTADELARHGPLANAKSHPHGHGERLRSVRL